MNNKKQKLLVEYLVSSTDTFAMCKSIVKPEFFDPDLTPVVEFIHTFYDKYHTTPDVDQIEAETNLKLTTRQVTKADVKFCADEVEVFCRHKAIESAVRKAPKLLEAGETGKIEQLIKDAVSVSLNRSMGLSYFANPMERLERQAQSPLRTSTGWKSVDDLLSGGLARGEMILFSANSGGGKSITLANLAKNFVEQKLNVLYISLELSEDLIGQRFDMMYTGIPTMLSRAKFREIGAQLEDLGPNLGELHVKYMPSGTNANTIRAYLKEFELQYGYIPDLLVVDYLDIMGANEYVSADNISEKDKRASEQLRDIGIEYNMFIATASQQNRDAIKAKSEDLNQSHIAGGITKVNTVDWYVSIIMNPVMKAAGEIGFAFLKTRSSDGVGKTIFMKWLNDTLGIKDHERAPSDDSLPVRQEKKSTLGLLDIMDVA